MALSTLPCLHHSEVSPRPSVTTWWLAAAGAAVNIWGTRMIGATPVLGISWVTGYAAIADEEELGFSVLLLCLELLNFWMLLLKVWWRWVRRAEVVGASTSRETGSQALVHSCPVTCDHKYWPLQTAILLFCICFSRGWYWWYLSPVQCHEPPTIIHQALY